MNGTLDISRPANDGDGLRFRFRLRDDTSRRVFLEFEIGAADLAVGLSGLAVRPVVYDLRLEAVAKMKAGDE